MPIPTVTTFIPIPPVTFYTQPYTRPQPAPAATSHLTPTRADLFLREVPIKPEPRFGLLRTLDNWIRGGTPKHPEPEQPRPRLYILA